MTERRPHPSKIGGQSLMLTKRQKLLAVAPRPSDVTQANRLALMNGEPETRTVRIFVGLKIDFECCGSTGRARCRAKGDARSAGRRLRHSYDPGAAMAGSFAG